MGGWRFLGGARPPTPFGAAPLAPLCLASLCLALALCCAVPGAAQEFFTLKGHGGPVRGIAVGPDGAILTASFDNSVGFWRDGAPVWLEGHRAGVNVVVFAGAGRAEIGRAHV